MKKSILKKIQYVIVAFMMIALFQSHANADTYFAENGLVPTPDSIVDLNQCSHSSSSSNGTLTKVSYGFTSFSNANGSPALFKEYMNYLETKGFEIKNAGSSYNVFLNGEKQMSISISGTTMNIDLVPGDPPVVEVEIEKLDSQTLDIGDKTELSFVQIEMLEVQRGNEIRERTSDGISYTRSTQNSKNELFWLKTSLKNTGKSSISFTGWKAMGRVVFDNKYSYDASWSKLVGGFDIAPMETVNVYIIAEVPTEVLDSYSNACIQFAFDQDFKQYDVFNDKIDDLDYVFEVQVGEPMEEEPLQSEQIILGEKITCKDYDLVIDKITFSHEVLPENMNGYYRSYPADSGKVYIDIDGHLTNRMKRDIRISELFECSAVYGDGYTYLGFDVVNRGTSFDWVQSYSAATPLETVHVHGLVECPDLVESGSESVVVLLKIDGQLYSYQMK